MRCNKCGEDNLTQADFNKNRYTCKYCDRKNSLAYKKKKLAVKRGLITRYLGKTCVICGETNRKKLRSHERYGQPHRNLADTSRKKLKENCKSGRFVRVCARCHGKAGDLLKKGIGWESAQYYIKEFIKTEPPVAEYPHQWAWEKFIETKMIHAQLELPLEVEVVTLKPWEIERIKAERWFYPNPVPAVVFASPIRIEKPFVPPNFFNSDRRFYSDPQALESVDGDEHWEDALDPEIFLMNVLEVSNG